MATIRVIKQTHWVSQTANPARLFALILCLLLSQALGFMHGIEHESRSNHRNHHLAYQQYHQNDHQKDTHLAATTSNGSTSWISDLLAGHSEESTCQVFDQLSHGSALLGHAVEMVQPTAAGFFLDSFQGATPAFRRSLVQARAPPAISTSS